MKRYILFYLIFLSLNLLFADFENFEFSQTIDRSFGFNEASLAVKENYLYCDLMGGLLVYRIFEDSLHLEQIVNEYDSSISSIQINNNYLFKLFAK